MNAVDMMRGKQLNIRLNDDEVARLHQVAIHYGLSVSDVIRMLLRREDLVIAAGKGADGVYTLLGVTPDGEQTAFNAFDSFEVASRAAEALSRRHDRKGEYVEFRVFTPKKVEPVYRALVHPPERKPRTR